MDGLIALRFGIVAPNQSTQVQSPKSKVQSPNQQIIGGSGTTPKIDQISI